MGKNFRQSGLSLTQLFLACIFVGAAGLLIIKILPEYVDYYKILSSVRAVAREANANPTISVREIKISLSKRFDIDAISGFSVADVDVGKSMSNQVEIEFAYQRVIPLFANISLMIDFKGSSDN